MVAPTKVDTNALGDALTNLADQQNVGKLIGFSGAFVSTVSSGGTELTPEQKALQQSMTDSVSELYVCKSH